MKSVKSKCLTCTVKKARHILKLNILVLYKSYNRYVSSLSRMSYLFQIKYFYLKEFLDPIPQNSSFATL